MLGRRHLGQGHDGGVLELTRALGKVGGGQQRELLGLARLLGHHLRLRLLHHRLRLMMIDHLLLLLREVWALM